MTNDTGLSYRVRIKAEYPLRHGDVYHGRYRHFPEVCRSEKNFYRRNFFPLETRDGSNQMILVIKKKKTE